MLVSGDGGHLMRNPVIVSAAAVLALFAANPVSAADRTCKGEAEASGDSKVEVDFTVDAKGAVVARSAIWTPPYAGNDDSENPVLTGAPQLAIEYDAAGEAGPGAPSLVSGTSMVTAGPTALTGASIRISLDGGRDWTAPLSFVGGGA